jgi:heme A synthase
MALALVLPVGVIGQAVLGGYTVENKLAPGFVMAHFSLSMVILVGAVALAWQAREHDPDAQPQDRQSVWAVRSLVPLAAIVIFAGTATTAAGPHSGGTVGQQIKTSRGRPRSTGPSTSTERSPSRSGWRRWRSGCCSSAARPIGRRGAR